MKVEETRPVASQDAPEADIHAPRPLTLAENVFLTIKVLGGLSLIGFAIWAISLWKTAQ